MRQHTSQTPQEVSSFTVAFSSQYISVILIILTFVIGAFGSQGLKTAKSGQAANLELSAAFQATSTRPEKLVGEVSYDDLFITGEEKLNEDRGRTIAQFLLAHDIKVVAEIPVEGLALRPVVLTRFLMKAGVPADALYIWGTAGAPTQETRLQFFREGE